MAVGAEVATGVLSSIVFEGLKRPLKTLTAEIRRRDQVGRALSERTSAKSLRADAQVEKIIGDLARIIGNEQGKLTVDVAAFLGELKRTALPEAIAQAALCGNTPATLKPAFQSFYNQYLPLPFSADAMFDGIYQACLSRFENVDDKPLLEIIRAQHGGLLEQLDLISVAIANGFSKKSAFSAAELREARLRVAKTIEATHRYVSVETLQGAKKFKLSSLAIPGRLVELTDLNIQAAKAADSSVPSSSYLNFRKIFDRAVILGDPGGGKSTLTQLLSHDLARLIGLESAASGLREFEGRDLKLPLRIVLRSFEAKQAKSPSYTFVDFLRDELKIALDNSNELTESLILRALSLGEALVIFDGLDEVLDVGARRSMVSLIEQFSQIYAACPILVTSRLVGYRDAPLCDEFTAYGLARFNMDEIRRYSEKSIRAVGQITVADAKLRADEFVKQSDKIGGELRENPLMLGLMVQIFVYRGDVPSNRPEVYKECATLMFEKWDGRRDIVADVPRQGVELLDVFGYVASRTFGDAGAEEGVSRGWLIAELRGHFEEWYVDRASAGRAATSLVDFLTGRAWVMSEVGPDMFKFTHRTFLEYFFARHLISMSRSVDDLISTLTPRIIENEWIVISHLALHMAVFRDGGKARQAADGIERRLSDLVLPPRQELALVEFISGSLEYLLIPETTYIRICEALIRRSIALGARAEYGAISVIHSLLETAKHRAGLATSAVQREVTAALVDPEAPEFLFAMYVLGARRDDDRRYMMTHSNAARGHTWDALDAIRKNKRKALFRIARSKVNIARAYIYIYEGERTELFRNHGPHLLMPSDSALVPPEVDQIVSSVLHELGAHVISRERVSEILDSNLQDAIQFVSLVADGVTR